jgi:2',3'-cyclic-nucleotide 2'-phosphodiesterase (5'-nucleotidase family)
MLVLAVILGACAPLPSQPAKTGPFELTILHTNDTWGYLDPCG